MKAASFPRSLGGADAVTLEVLELGNDQQIAAGRSAQFLSQHFQIGNALGRGLALN